MTDDELDLSELLDEDEEAGETEDPAPDFEYPDRTFVQMDPAAGLLAGFSSDDDGVVEYIRADTLREGFTTKIWREAVRYARRTPREPAAALKRARDLIEEGR